MRCQLSEMAKQRTRLLEDQVELKGENEKLKEDMSALESQLRDMHDKMINLVRAASKLEKEFVKLKNKSPTISEADKQKIINEYKTSPELTEAILGQFDEGYQGAKAKIKAKILAAGLEPQLLDSSNEESETEENPHPLNECILLFFILLLLNL